MKQIFLRCFRLAATGVAAVCLPAVALGYPAQQQTGVTIYNKAAAYPTDVLFTGADNKTYLINMQGKVVHEWNYTGFPVKAVDPAAVGGRKGVIGLQLSDLKVSNGIGVTGLLPGAPSFFRNAIFGLVDWKGHVIWSWGKQAPGGVAMQHHDWDLLPNGDFLLLTNVARHIPGFGNRLMLDDVLREVSPSGKVVWSWSVVDHLKEFGFTPAALKLMMRTKAPDFMHTNAAVPLGPNRWYKAGYKDFAPDNIMISSRDANFIAIIDRATGKVVWRIGPYLPRRDPRHPGVVPRPVDQIVGQHDPHLIPEGLPGAGDLLVFDDQGEAGYPPVPLELQGGSRVLEINPVSKKIVWEYTGADSGSPPWSFYSSFLGSAQRLPNGNTLIDEGENGRFFQVTPDGKIVWQYVSPFLAPHGAATPGHARPQTNMVYRCQGVPASWLPPEASEEKVSESR